MNFLFYKLYKLSTTKGLDNLCPLCIMDTMLGENKNLKDTSDSIKDSQNTAVSLTPPWKENLTTYTKIDKLITALYMVTDIMEKDEPIRFKLRTLGVELLSDINSFKKDTAHNLKDKINSILSFLSISFDINMISEMNFNILKKEFIILGQSIEESSKKDSIWLEEFTKTSSVGNRNNNPLFTTFETFPVNSSKDFSKGQSTRLGVQKGSTLLKALHKVSNPSSDVLYKPEEKENFEVLKNKRREEILLTIKSKRENCEKNLIVWTGSTITDIKNEIKNLPSPKTSTLISCGDKTLQRELISMVKDNVLYKKGEKRWSRYFLR